MTTDTEAFNSTFQDFNRALDFALRVSVALRGSPANQQGQLASAVHFKMCMHGASIRALSGETPLDHSAILAVSRMLVDGMTMYYYLLEPVADEEWKCRYLVLKLHDTVGRIKLIRAKQVREQYTDLIKGREELFSSLNNNSFFAGLTEEQRTRCLTGEAMFVGGMRAAAERAAGWNGDQFQSLYNYFSAHLHVAPISYFRLEEHKIGFMEISDVQRGLAMLGLSVGEFCLVRTSLDRLARRPEQEANFDQAELTEFRQLVEQSTVLGRRKD
jgi:hypothetical protein